MKYFILLLIFSSSILAEQVTLSFIFSHTAEMADQPRLTPRETRMEVTFDPKTLKGKLKSYSPFSDSFELIDVSVKIEGRGVHFIEEKGNGIAILSFGLQANEASYSNSTVSYGVLTSYQLYGQGRLLEQR